MARMNREGVPRIFVPCGWAFTLPPDEDVPRPAAGKRAPQNAARAAVLAMLSDREEQMPVCSALKLAAGIRRVKGVKKLGVRLGNWLTAEEARRFWQAPDPDTLKGKRDRAILAVLLERSSPWMLDFGCAPLGVRPQPAPEVEPA